MATAQKSLRIRAETVKAVERISRESGVDFSTATNQLLEEAVRMRRCPGIVFTRGATGRRATVAGTGVDVWEIVSTHESLGRDDRRLRKAYHWLSEAQLRAALAYAELYPEEVDDWRRRNESWTRASLARRHPALVSNAAPVPRRKRSKR